LHALALYLYLKYCPGILRFNIFVYIPVCLKHLIASLVLIILAAYGKKGGAKSR